MKKSQKLSYKIIARLSLLLSALLSIVIIASYFGLKHYYLNNFYYDKAEDIALTATKQIESLIKQEIDSKRFTVEDFLAEDYRELSIEECVRLWTDESNRDMLSRDYLEKMFKAVDSKNPSKIEDYRRYMTTYSADEELGKKIR